MKMAFLLFPVVASLLVGKMTGPHTSHHPVWKLLGLRMPRCRTLMLHDFLHILSAMGSHRASPNSRGVVGNRLHFLMKGLQSILAIFAFCHNHLSFNVKWLTGVSFPIIFELQKSMLCSYFSSIHLAYGWFSLVMDWKVCSLAFSLSTQTSIQ